MRILNANSDAVGGPSSGAKTVAIYVTDTTPTTTYATNVDASVQVYSGDIPMETIGNETWFVVPLSQTLSGRYVVIDIQNNHGGANPIALRKVELSNNFNSIWTPAQ